MARQKFVSRAKAAEFDVTTLLNANAPKQGFLCLSAPTWELCYQLVQFYGDWRSRYYYTDPATGEQLTVTDEEYGDILQAVQFAQEELQMAGCDDLVQAVTNIAGQLGVLNIAVQSGSQCCTAYGELPATPIDEGTPGVDPPPTGFSTWAEYFAYKCAAANRIADDFIQTIANLATLSGLVATISAAALGLFLSTSLLSGILVGLMIVGFSAAAAAAIIIGALVTLIVVDGVSLAYFATLASDMETDKETLVCILFSATTTQGAKSDVLDWLESTIAAMTFSGSDETPFTNAATAIFGGLFNDNMLNLLFSLDEDTSEYVGDIDCDDCQTCNAILAVFGTNTGGDTWQSELAPEGNYVVWLAFNVYDNLQSCGDVASNLVVYGLTGHTNYVSGGGNDQDFRVSGLLDVGNGCANWDIYCSDTNPLPYEYDNVRHINIRSATNFTVTIEVTP